MWGIVVLRGWREGGGVEVWLEEKALVGLLWVVWDEEETQRSEDVDEEKGLIVANGTYQPQQRHALNVTI